MLLAFAWVNCMCLQRKCVSCNYNMPTHALFHASPSLKRNDKTHGMCKCVQVQWDFSWLFMVPAAFPKSWQGLYYMYSFPVRPGKVCSYFYVSSSMINIFGQICACCKHQTWGKHTIVFNYLLIHHVVHFSHGDDGCYNSACNLQHVSCWLF